MYKKQCTAASWPQQMYTSRNMETYFCPHSRSVLTSLIVPLRGPSLLPAPGPSHRSQTQGSGPPTLGSEFPGTLRRKLSCAPPGHSPAPAPTLLHQPTESAALVTETGEAPDPAAEEFAALRLCRKSLHCLTSVKKHKFSG